MRVRFGTRGHRRGLCAAASLAAIAGWSLSAQAAPTLQPNAQPPDFAEQVPTHLKVDTVRLGHKTYFHLAFQSIAENLAKTYNGRVFFVGHRPSSKQRTMTADEYVSIVDPHTGNVVSQQVFPNIGEFIYRNVAGHDHWHLRTFETYQLRRASDYALVSHDRKIGYCVTSDVRVPDPGLHSADAGARSASTPKLITRKDITPLCGRGKSKLLRVVEGLDAGTGDVYEDYLDGQYVDVTNAPNGRYVLVLHVNPAHRFVESDYTNDFASILISLHRSKPGARPTFRVLRSCPGSKVCPPS